MSPRSRIYLVQLVEERTGVLLYKAEYARIEVIGVFRKREGDLESRRYRPYHYRGALRHRRYLRILGRHLSTDYENGLNG